MKRTMRNILFSLVTTLLFFGLAELYLRGVQYEGTSVSDLVETAGFPDNAYVHKRDRILGSWYIRTKNGYRSNPKYLQRGFHKETFLHSEKRIFSIGGSTTYGSPFEHQERGFSERLEKKQRQNIKIVNAGVAGMDSSAFPALSRELSEIGGEGVIIYTGNNEIRGALMSMCTLQEKHLLSNVRTYRWLQDSYRTLSGFQYTFNHLAKHQEDCIADSVQDVLSHQDVNFSQNRQDLFYRTLLTNFTDNLSTSIETFISKNMNIWLFIPPINLHEKPAYAHIAPYLPEETASIVSSLERLKDWESILLLDPTHADANYHIGMRNTDIERLRIAAEFDYASRRITPSIQQALVNVCDKFKKQVTCIDMRYIEEGDVQNFFVDFCHPTFNYGVNTIVESLLPHIE